MGKVLQIGKLFYNIRQFLQDRAVHGPKLHQRVGQKKPLLSPIPLICLLGARINGDIYLQIGPMWFESRVVQYVEIAFRRDRPFFGMYIVPCICLRRKRNPKINGLAIIVNG